MLQGWENFKNNNRGQRRSRAPCGEAAKLPRGSAEIERYKGVVSIPGSSTVRNRNPYRPLKLSDKIRKIIRSIHKRKIKVNK